MKFFGNASKSETAYNEVVAALAPALARAKITTLTVEGRTVPASEAPAALQVAALLAAHPIGEGQQEVNNLHVTNANLAAQNEALTDDNATLQATVGGLQVEKQTLITRATVAEAALETSTAKCAQKDVEIQASQANFNRVDGELKSLNADISRRCLAVGCLMELKGANGAALASTATADEKQAAAERIPPAEKLASFNGAVNAALTRLGVNVATLPGAPANGTNVPAISTAIANANILAQLEAIKDPTERARFHAKHRSEIFAAVQALPKT